MEEKTQMILAIRAPPGSKIELPKNDLSMPSANEYHDLLSYLKKKYRVRKKLTGGRTAEKVRPRLKTTMAKAWKYP